MLFYEIDWFIWELICCSQQADSKWRAAVKPQLSASFICGCWREHGHVFLTWDGWKCRQKRRAGIDLRYSLVDVINCYYPSPRLVLKVARQLDCWFQVWNVVKPPWKPSTWFAFQPEVSGFHFLTSSVISCGKIALHFQKRNRINIET